MDRTREISGWQRGMMIGAPLLLGGLLLLHPSSFGESPDAWVQQLASMKERWLIQHVIQMPLFAALGLIVLWMLPRHGTASQVSRIALAVYIVFYPAFDALVGIGSGLLLRQRSLLGAADQAVLDKAIQALFFDPAGLALWMAIVASASWSVGAVAGAIALWRSAGCFRLERAARDQVPTVGPRCLSPAAPSTEFDALSSTKMTCVSVSPTLWPEWVWAGSHTARPAVMVTSAALPLTTP
jgi:hypothetical protein